VFACHQKGKGPIHYRTKHSPATSRCVPVVAKDVDGLMMAGRCISGDFIAHVGYRVTGNAVAMGEAASVTAALAVKNKNAPHDVPWREVKPVIEKSRKPVLFS